MLAALSALTLALTLLPTPAHASEAATPFCEGSNLRDSMLRAGSLTVSPEPGTDDATPATQISIVGAPASELTDITVTGSRSGTHTGELRPYSQGDGGSFVLAKPLLEGERVTVKLKLSSANAGRQVGWQFGVGEKAGLGSAYAKTTVATSASTVPRARVAESVEGAPAKERDERIDGASGKPGERVVDGVPATKPGERVPGEPAKKHGPKSGTVPTETYHSEPNLHPPDVFVDVKQSDPQSGYLFLSPFANGQAGPMILDGGGRLVWFHPVNVGPEPASKATNLQVQTYKGEPVLTWWQDPLKAPHSRRRKPEDILYDEAYQRVGSVRAGNGLVADVHEFQITPQDTALLAIKHDVRCNLSKVGGSPNGSVWDDVIQEIDIDTGLVRWEWNSLDHVSLAEAYDSVKYATSSYPFDFFHMNSIQPIEGDALFVSARDTWAMYDIDRRTGLIRWRLGGKRSNFAMGQGTRTAWQHDARDLGPGPEPDEMLVTVFDNGATPKEHTQSRALEETLNLKQHTATERRELTHAPHPILAGSQGSVQVLADGETLVGWGQAPWVTEYEPTGSVNFDAHLSPVEQSYRALRYEWDGKPATPPKIAVEALGAGRLAVYASWNGATDVASWQILEGSSAKALASVASAAFSGFETKIEAPVAKGAKIVVAQALGAGGEVLASSAGTTP